MTCPCPLPDGGGQYHCEVITKLSGIETQMCAPWCRLYRTDEKYREYWNRVGGPGAARDQAGPKKKRRKHAGIDRPAVPTLSVDMLAGLATKLAELSGSNHPLDNQGLYAKPLAQWLAAGCETRDDEEQAFVLQFCRGGCPRNQKCYGRCPKYHLQSDSCQCGQGCGPRKPAIPLAIRAVMASESCPGMKW